MAVTNSINTLNQTISLISGTGSVGIGNDASAKTITIGSVTTNTSITISSGTGGISIGNDSISKTITIGASGSDTITLQSGTGGISLWNDAIAKTITIGSSSSGFSGTLQSGTGGISIGANATVHTTSIGNTGGTSGPLNISSGTGGINIGNDSIVKAVTIGSGSNNTIVTFNANTISGNGGITFPSTNVSGTSGTFKSGKYFIANNASQVTFGLPTSGSGFNSGDILRIIGGGIGGWKITQGASQQIVSTAASTTVGSGGSLTSGGQYDCISLICVGSNLWSIMSSVGTLTFV